MKGVVIEGIDCSGKSTLIKTLKFKLKKYGGFDVKELEHIECNSQYQRYLYEYVANKNILFDRSHISELVYGKILRNSIPFTAQELQILNEVLKLEYILVVARVNYDDFIIRMKQSRQYQVISEDLFEQINASFELFTTNINPIQYVSSSYNELESISNTVVNIVIKKF